MVNFAINRSLMSMLLISSALSVSADNWVRDTEPSILEVRYTRTQVTDTMKRETDFFNEETMLRIGNGMSSYCSVTRYYRDSLMYCAPDLYWQMEAASFEKDPQEHDRTSLERNGRYGSFIYKNYPPGKVTETQYFDMQSWRYEEDWEKPQWEITDDTKDIIGYQCFKAVTDYRGRQWTAWFSPEIPVQDGPWKLCGLPGLILEAIDNHAEYHFIANGLKQNGVPEVGFLCYREKHGVRTVSRNDFFKNWWQYANSNFGAKMAAIFRHAPQPAAKEQEIQHRDKEETDYPHEL